METHLDDRRAVLDGLEGFGAAPLTVVGHSMGGHIALRHCLESPDRVARAVLIAPMLGIGRRGLPTGLARLLVEFFCRTPLLERYVFGGAGYGPRRRRFEGRSEEHTSELQSLMRISYAVLCLQKTPTQTK